MRVFYVRYLRNELVRRRTRTIVTLLGLGLGVALVIVISSLSNGLDKAQKKTLNPLAGIGTDLTVTLQPQQDTGRRLRRPGRRRRRRAIATSSRRTCRSITDLSKLGKAGTHFVHDFFLPGTQLTFKQTAASQIASIAGVGQVTQGLTLLAEHQEGIVPKIVATLKTQAKTFQIQRNIPRPTAAQFAAMQACLQKLNPREFSGSGGSNGSGSGGFGGGGGGGFGGGGSAAARTVRVREVPAREPAQVPHALHLAEPDAAPGAESAADEHHDHRVHDRRRRPDRSDDGRRHDRAGDEGPLPRRRPAVMRRSSRRPTRRSTR